MCQVGHADWLFTDSSACYVGPDLRLKQCVCPLTTCSRTSTGYACRFSTSVIVLSTFLVLVWMVAVAVYVYVIRLIEDLEVEKKSDKELMMGRDYFYEKLFGARSPTTADMSRVTIMPTKEASS